MCVIHLKFEEGKERKKNRTEISLCVRAQPAAAAVATAAITKRQSERRRERESKHVNTEQTNKPTKEIAAPTKTSRWNHHCHCQ